MDELNDGDFALPSRADNAKAEPLPDRKEDARKEVWKTIRWALLAGALGNALFGAIGTDIWIGLKLAVIWVVEHVGVSIYLR